MISARRAIPTATQLAAITRQTRYGEHRFFGNSSDDLTSEEKPGASPSFGFLPTGLPMWCLHEGGF
jgi:hypothetical protein